MCGCAVCKNLLFQHNFIKRVAFSSNGAQHRKCSGLFRSPPSPYYDSWGNIFIHRNLKHRENRCPKRKGLRASEPPCADGDLCRLEYGCARGGGATLLRAWVLAESVWRARLETIRLIASLTC